MKDITHHPQDSTVLDLGTAQPPTCPDHHVVGQRAKDYTRDMAEAVALAVSNYLGRTVGSRSSIYHEVINSHKLRGKVVHGKQVDAENFKEMTTKTGNLLRRSLRQRIEE